MDYLDKLRLPPHEFTRLLTDDLRRELDCIENILLFVRHDTDSQVILLEDLSRKLTIYEICELILQRVDRTRAMIAAVQVYAESSHSADF